MAVLGPYSLMIHMDTAFLTVSYDDYRHPQVKEKPDQLIHVGSNVRMRRAGVPIHFGIGAIVTSVRTRGDRYTTYMVTATLPYILTLTVPNEWCN
jgi:hypothetical protein